MRETNHERLLTVGNTQRAAEGEVGGGIGNWGMGTQEGMGRMSTGYYTVC